MEIKKVIYCKGKKFYWKEGDLHTSFGSIKEEDIINKSKTLTNKEKEVIILPADFIDKTEKMKIGPQRMLLKDVGEIIVQTGMNKESKVLEIGTGSGVLTAFMAKIAKEIISYEIREDHLSIAQKNLNNLGIDNVKLINKDATLEIIENEFDIATIDIKEPWLVLDNVSNSLKKGGYIVSYSPSLTQSNEVIKLAKKGNELKAIKTIEVIEREWEIKKQIMHPEINTVNHTAFLTFIRKI